MNLGVAGINKYPISQNMKIDHVVNSATNKSVSKPNYINSNSGMMFKGGGIYEPEFFPVPFIEKYVTSDTIQKAIDKDPNIFFILEYNGIEPRIYETNIDNRLKNHLLTTYLYAKEIATKSNLSSEQKGILYRSALLHDIGKGLIPEEIVQKPGKLTEEERRIIDLHARLGYEILKSADVDFDIAEAVRLHHSPVYEKNGNVVAQILSVADVFSALKEERAYKPPLTNSEAFEIMADTPYLLQDYVDILRNTHI